MDSSEYYIALKAYLLGLVERYVEEARHTEDDEARSVHPTSVARLEDFETYVHYMLEDME